MSKKDNVSCLRNGSVHVLGELARGGDDKLARCAERISAYRTGVLSLQKPLQGIYIFRPGVLVDK